MIDQGRHTEINAIILDEYRFANIESNNQALGSIKDKILSARKITTITHPNPDPDAIGSSYAFYKIAKLLNPDAQNRILLPTESPYNTDFISEGEELEVVTDSTEVDEAESLFVLDIGDLKRVKKLVELFNPQEIANIDHHPGSPGLMYSDTVGINLVDGNFESTTEILYWMAKKCKLPISSALATSLLFGLFGDTESFADINLSPRLDLVRYDLKNLGADENSIVLNSVRAIDQEELRLAAHALERLVVKDNFSYVALNYEDFSRLSRELSKPFEKAVVVEMLRRIEGVDFGFVMIEQEPDSIQCSLKARTDNVDLSQIAESYGGGGHPLSSGFRLKGNFEDTLENVIASCISRSSESR
ncbi:MAG: DHH family phosphoesterase [Patescibacteria group bacterium]